MKSSETPKKIDNPHLSLQNYHNNDQFPTDTISFQVSKPVQPGDDISSTINTIKCFLSKIGKNTLPKTSNTLSDIPKLQNIAVIEVMETVTSTYISHVDRAEPLNEAAYGEDLLSLFKQYSLT